MTTIFLGSDHAGYELKQFLTAELQALGHTVIDKGCHSKESCDYPHFAREVCQAVLKDNAPGILICGTGLGMSMAANRIPGIRAALCTVEIMARLARRHNNANVLCMGERIVGRELALAIALAFLDTDFEGGRHQRRVDQIDNPATSV